MPTTTWFARNRCWQPLDRGFSLKICIVGTSHITSLKLGWEMVKSQFPDLQIVFFGGIGGSLRHLRVRNAKLVSIDDKLTRNLKYTSGGISEIDPDIYDAVILYGLNLKLPRLRQGISRAVMKETIKDIVQRSLTLKVAAKFRKLNDRGFWIGANPMEGVNGNQLEAGPFYSYGQIMEEAAHVFPVPGATFLPQPAETIGPDLRALSRFLVGSVRLMPSKNGNDSVAHPDDDFRHMNGEFGHLWLLQNLPIVMQGTADK